MPYTTTQLITGAYYATAVVSREFETVSGEQQADALVWLNDILSEKTVDEAMIPYETVFNSNFIIGQNLYYIPNLVQIDTLCFFLDEVRYGMQQEQRDFFQGSSRVESIQSLPYKYFLELTFGGGNLNIYFPPDRAYPFQINGIFRLSSVTLGQDLSVGIEQFYTTYLRYALADRICSEYSLSVPAGVTEQLSKYESWINKKSRVLDLRMQKTSTLQKRGGISWAFVNLSGGWVRSNGLGG